MNRTLTLVAAFSVVVLTSIAHADVSLPTIFGDNMVLQQNVPLRIFGTAAPNEKIEITLADDHEQTDADPTGHWHLTLKPLPATDVAHALTILAANTLTFQNILIGEVWICSGQSNMEYHLDRATQKGMSPPPSTVEDQSTESLKSASDDKLRIFRVEKDLKADLISDGWHAATGEELGNFSAVGYFFGKNLRAKLKVPVGLIGTYWGGSRIERWTPAGAYENVPLLRAATTQPGIMDNDTVAKYYTRMVAPMAGFPIKGMIWYQGESNLIETNNKNYGEKFQAFADSWRKAWNQGDFPIGTVQIAPLDYTKRTKDPVQHTPETLPEFWRIQADIARQVRGVGLIPTADLGDHLTNIHPWNKWDVGARLANWALATVYHENAPEWSGPIVETVAHNGAEVRVQFTHAEGLHPAGGKDFRGFELKNAAGEWLPAQAENADNNSLQIHTDHIPDPHGVRYAWKQDAPVTLINSANLPAISFQKEW